MVYNEHRYIQSAKFKNKCEIAIFNPTVQINGIVSDGTAETTQTRYFSYLQESGLMSGEMADDRIMAETGLVIKENQIQCVFKFNPVLFSALENRKKVVVTYQNKKFTPTSFVNPGGEKTYLLCSLKAVETNA